MRIVGHQFDPFMSAKVRSTGSMDPIRGMQLCAGSDPIPCEAGDTLELLVENTTAFA